MQSAVGLKASVPQQALFAELGVPGLDALRDTYLPRALARDPFWPSQRKCATLSRASAAVQNGLTAQILKLAGVSVKGSTSFIVMSRDLTDVSNEIGQLFQSAISFHNRDAGQGVHI